MYTAVINVKTHPEIKNQAKKIAEELGFSLSSLVNAYLKQLIKTKTVVFSTVSEDPSEYMIKMLKQAEKEIKEGKVVSFKSGNEALTYLDYLIENEQSKRN
jgi:addiction module RelB/DinJ family antitoxin